MPAIARNNKKEIRDEAWDPSESVLIRTNFTVADRLFLTPFLNKIQAAKDAGDIEKAQSIESSMTIPVLLNFIINWTFKDENEADLPVSEDSFEKLDEPYGSFIALQIGAVVEAALTSANDPNGSKKNS